MKKKQKKNKGKNLWTNDGPLTFIAIKYNGTLKKEKKKKNSQK